MINHSIPTSVVVCMNCVSESRLLDPCCLCAWAKERKKQTKQRRHQKRTTFGRGTVGTKKHGLYVKILSPWLVIPQIVRSIASEYVVSSPIRNYIDYDHVALWIHSRRGSRMNEKRPRAPLSSFSSFELHELSLNSTRLIHRDVLLGTWQRQLHARFNHRNCFPPSGGVYFFLSEH